MENDYSLLRPFDLEAAKRGEKLLFTEVLKEAEFVAGPDSDGEICVRHAIDNTLLVRQPGVFSMAPLCWVRVSAEDDTLRPVYKGDVLYSSFFSECDRFTGKEDNAGRFVASGILDGGYIEAGERGSSANTHTEQCTWTPPKVKREGWVNIYPEDESGVGMNREVFGPFATKQ